MLNITDTNLTVGADPVGDTFRMAAMNGMNTVRIFGHGVVPAFPLQPTPGEGCIKTCGRHLAVQLVVRWRMVCQQQSGRA